MPPFHAAARRPLPQGFRAVLAALVLVLGFQTASAQGAPDGQAIFQANCASCHNPLKDATGPALQGVDARVPGKEWLYKWIHNSSAVIASGDKYANDLFVKWNKTQMTAFPQLKNEEIDAVITYVNNVKAPAKGGPTGGAQSEAAAAGAEEGNSLVYTGITLLLLLAAIVLWRANAALKRAAAEKAGEPVVKEIPLYRSKLVIAVVIILALCFGGIWIVNGAANMGNQQNYKPEQPIYYSHKVHAGINQINCLYCHAGAEKSKHAMIPSTNVCMNCHKQINVYTGADEHPLGNRDDGTPIDGTAEIQKLYKYAGWDPVKKEYKRDTTRGSKRDSTRGNILAKSPEWVKIHNLPDHVYFNHSQHVAVGKVACQRCHGAIQEMDEVYQAAPLRMGWCINCHRQSQVQFKENAYYNIYEKYHAELKAGQREGVTVEDIGGIECQKCHY